MFYSLPTLFWCSLGYVLIVQDASTCVSILVSQLAALHEWCSLGYVMIAYDAHVCVCSILCMCCRCFQSLDPLAYRCTSDASATFVVVGN